jgi:CHAT domain-containing protein/Flp pilus assembly protein TadD
MTIKTVAFFSLFVLISFIASSQDQAWRAQYDTCKVNYNNGKIDLATQWLEKSLPSLKINSKDSTLYYEVVNLLARCYLKSGRHTNAEDLFKKDIDYFTTHETEISRKSYTTSIIYLGYLYYNTKRYKESEKYFNDALELKSNERLSPSYSVIVNNLATLAYIDKNFKKADSLYQIMTLLKKEVYGENSAEYAIAVTTLGNMYRKTGQYNDAEPMYAKAIAIRKEISGIKNTEYLTAVSQLANLYNLQGRYREAEPLYIETIAISKQIYPREKIEYTRSIQNLATLYKTMSRYNEAETLYQEVLSTRHETTGDNTLDYASALINLGLLYKAMNEYNKSEMYFLSALSIYEVIIGEYHESYVSALINLAGLYRTIGRLQEAEPIYNKALGIYKTTSGTKTINYANLLNNIALYYDEVGRYEQAEDYYKKALEITQELLGENNPEYATTLNNFALLYKNTGHLEQSEPLYKQAAKIRKETLGEKHPEYATSLNNLASLYESMGNTKEAEVLYLQSSQIIKDVFGTQNHYYANSLINLGALYEIQKKYDEAEKLYNQALEIIKVTLGDKHPEYATALNNLALLQQGRGNYKQAEKLYLDNLQKTKEALGIRHPNYATALSNLAGLYEHMARYGEAEKLYLEAFKIREEILGKKHPSYTLTLSSLARLYTAVNKYDLADTLWDRTLSNYLEEIQDFFPQMSEKEKGQFYNTISHDFEQFNSFAVIRSGIHPASISRMYNNQLATKALLLNSSNKLRQRILSSNDTALIHLFKNWVSQKEFLSKIYSLSKAEIKKLAINVDSIEHLNNELEKKLSLKSELFKNTNEIKYYTWQDVQKQLKEDEAAIEIIRFPKYKFDSAGVYSDSIFYAALIVKKSTVGNPQLVLLKNGIELEKRIINYYKNSIRIKSKDELSYNEFWRMINMDLSGIRKVYFSPDGVYNQVNIKSLYNSETKKYVFDEMEFHNVTNTKDLITHHTLKVGKKQMVLIGNPNYSLEDGKKTQTLINDSYANYLNQLPGTEVEVSKINKTMAHSGWTTKLYIGNEATEKTIKSIRNPKILHIATHGFFEKDPVVKEDNTKDADKITENPLLRSGLMLAGASITLYNKRHAVFSADKIETDFEDGILTAYEAMNLNLDNTDLVILSACETGQGEIINGEGVYGLQRAFVIAGARTIIISLWKVNDETTQKLMSAFYEEFTKTGNKEIAFKNAQSSLKREFADPYYWGAFVMVGE